MVDLTRKGDFAEKKAVCASAAKLVHGDVSDTANYELFNLPPNALITAAYCVVHVAGQANLTVDFGFDGAAELGNDMDIDEVGPVEGAPDAGALDTGTGKKVTAKFSAAPTAGEFTFVVEYIEYTLGTGKLTDKTRA